MSRTWVIEAPGKRDAFLLALNEAGYENDKVLATYGRLYDLPDDDLGFDIKTVSNEDIPTEIRWVPKRQSQLKKLVQLIAESDEIFIATDADLEGELIASQVMNLCLLAQKRRGSDISVSRLKVKGLSAHYIKEAVSEKSAISEQWVKAAKSRRVLDRLLGYSMHSDDDPWRLSIGRITSPLVHSLQQKAAEAVVIRRKLDDDWNIIVRLDSGRANLASSIQTVLGSLPSPTISKVSEEEIRFAHKPLTGPEAIKLCLRSLNAQPNEVVDALQANYQKGKLSYHRTDSREMDEVALKWAQRMANAQAVEFSMQTAEQRQAEVHPDSHRAHNAVTPITDKIPSLHVPIQHLSVEEAVLRTIASHTMHVGESDEVIQKEIGALDLNDITSARWNQAMKSWADCVEFIRYIDDSGFAQDPLQRELPRAPDVEDGDVAIWRHHPAQIAIERLMELDLARPSTIHVLAEKALYNYLDSNGLVNGRGQIMIEKVMERLPSLLNPEIAKDIERVVSNVGVNASIGARLNQAWKLLNVPKEASIRGGAAPEISLHEENVAPITPQY